MAKVALRLRRSREREKLIIEEKSGMEQWRKPPGMNRQRRRKRKKEKRSKNFSALQLTNWEMEMESWWSCFVIISFASSLGEFIICHSSYMMRDWEYLQSSLFGWKTAREFFLFISSLKTAEFYRNRMYCAVRGRWRDDAKKKRKNAKWPSTRLLNEIGVHKKYLQR